MSRNRYFQLRLNPTGAELVLTGESKTMSTFSDTFIRNYNITANRVSEALSECNNFPINCYETLNICEQFSCEHVDACETKWKLHQNWKVQEKLKQ